MAAKCLRNCLMLGCHIQNGLGMGLWLYGLEKGLGWYAAKCGGVASGCRSAGRECSQDVL